MTAETRKRSNSRRRPIILATRVSPAECERIYAEAEARGMSVSEFLRNSALACSR